MIKTAFSSFFYTEQLQPKSMTMKKFLRQIFLEVDDISSQDKAGQDWSKKNYLNGYTSYASVNSIQKISPTFQELEKLIDVHVKKYANFLDYDLCGVPLRMSTCWINIMPTNAYHGLHIHPLSVISGTFYVQVPKGASAIKFEDPRLGYFMGQPARKPKCKEKNLTHMAIPAEPGKLALFESWQKHEVPINGTPGDRISISFNYEWGE